jgi:hypothetical protein
MARDRSTYKDPLEVRGVLTGMLADSHDDGGQLRDVVPGVALAGDVEVAALVLGKPLEPMEQEDIGVRRRPRVAGFVIVRGRVGVGEADSGRRLQEDHVGHCMCTQNHRHYYVIASYMNLLTSHIPLFQAFLFLLSVLPSGLTRDGPVRKLTGIKINLYNQSSVRENIYLLVLI